MKIYSYGKQSISQRDINAVVDALNSDTLTQGALIQEFEKNISKYTDAKYCVALSSATAALHLSMIALKIGEDDEVITSTNTFVASANCARYVGASVRFADIDPETANISVCEIKKQITSKTKAIIPVHFAGQSCDMEAVHDLAQERGLYVVEDAAHAFGSDYKNKKVGSCTYSDMTIFSFHPVKTITTGEGGAVTTNNKELYEKILLLRSHGIEKKSSMIETHGKWYYEMHQLGFNYRMTEIQAALGISQLKKVEQFKEKRRYIISLYKKLFSEDSRIAFLEEKEYSNACFHLCPVLIDFEKLKIDKKKFIDGLFDVGLRLQIHYIPVHWQPY
ncbi:MAG: UDP-4-amino-4,6-dideoxy-N-acetyl-beta-L-altrosamine transaminase, partial [Holosporaceae bacterium]|nr:UDP-4-amino-4,6-dideoxy-N-acetyl-beta-L-altrosamine transaminase [Holosporaceae bacterium]